MTERAGHTPPPHSQAAANIMAKKNKSKPLDNEDDGGQEEEEPDFSDPEDFVDEITDEGERLGEEMWEGGIGRSNHMSPCHRC